MVKYTGKIDFVSIAFTVGNYSLSNEQIAQSYSWSKKATFLMCDSCARIKGPILVRGGIENPGVFILHHSIGALYGTDDRVCRTVQELLRQCILTSGIWVFFTMCCNLYFYVWRGLKILNLRLLSFTINRFDLHLTLFALVLSFSTIFYISWKLPFYTNYNKPLDQLIYSSYSDSIVASLSLQLPIKNFTKLILQL